jgi:hypothetical protein
MEPVHLRDDLKMEVALVICEWPDEKVLTLYGEGKLEFYVARVIINMLTNKYSPFYKKFRTYFEPILDSNDSIMGDREKQHRASIVEQVNNTIANLADEDIELRKDRESLEDMAMEEIDRLYWYDAELLRIYLRVGNFRAMGKETGIPYISCYKSVKKSMALLKKKAESAMPGFTKKELSFIQNNRI